MNKSVSELGPRLIAPTRTINPTLDIIHGSLYSVDMVRISFEHTDYQEILDALDKWQGLQIVSTYTSTRIGSFRVMWVWDKADAKGTGLKEGDGTEGVKIKAGFGLITPSGKTEPKGFVEFNPNKVPEKGNVLVSRIVSHGCIVELSRYDLAIDYPIERDSLRMVKDRRKYGCEISDGMTEYLGQRNQPGRVKVYDKQKESQLDRACTRVELTCSGEWELETVLDKLPVVYTYTGIEFESLRGVTKAFALAAMANGDKEPPEAWLRMVDPKTRTKIRNAIKRESVTLHYDEKCISRTIEKARAMAK